MNSTPLNLLLADDDLDDCIFFKEVLHELAYKTTLTMVNDGVMLMNHLKYEVDKIPDALFLDLNMPRKTGFECLAEIKQHHKLKQLPVIIFSTSFDNTIANKLHEQGAHFYIRKPAEFSDLKNIISESLKLLLQYPGQPGKEKFVLNSR